MLRCSGCFRQYDELAVHHARMPVCASWVRVRPLRSAQRDAAEVVEGSLQLPMTDWEQWQSPRPSASPAAGPCAPPSLRYADPRLWTLADTGADAGACYPHDEFESPAYSLCHIIWNVFLIDREMASRPDFVKIVEENNVKHIVAILPEADLYEACVKAPRVSHSVIEYEGHDTALHVDAFEEQCTLIEAHRRERGNVFVFCNNGYQRSIPFLCYYLTRFHAEEVPTVEQAIEIILPQVDKANFAALRAPLVASVKALFQNLP
jgi:hypothetical protein